MGLRGRFDSPALWVMAFALACAGCRSGTGVVETTNVADIRQMEQMVLDHINEHRLLNGLSKLKECEQVSELARKHSEDLAAGKVDFGHVGFDRRVAKLRESLRIEAAAENEGYVKGVDDPATTIVNAWLESKGHRENIEGDFNIAGVGGAQGKDKSFCLTVIFLKVIEGSRAAELQTDHSARRRVGQTHAVVLAETGE